MSGLCAPPVLTDPTDASMPDRTRLEPLMRLLAVVLLLAVTPPGRAAFAQRATQAPQLPWLEAVEPAYRDRVADVLAAPSLAIPPLAETFAGDVGTYEKLLFRPDLVARLWQVAGYSGTEVTAGDDGWFLARDRQGNDGRWRYVYRGQTLAVAYGEGRFRSPLRTIVVPFRVVVVWRYSDALIDGRHYITHIARASFQLQRPSQHRLLIALRPLAAPLARQRLQEAMLSVSIPVRLAARDSDRFREWLQRAAITEPVVAASPAPRSSPPAE